MKGEGGMGDVGNWTNKHLYGGDNMGGGWTKATKKSIGSVRWYVFACIGT